MATADADGRCDVSPKGDAAGFVQVLDDRRLMIPDRPGNRRLDGMQNLVSNPHVGLVFIVPGREETLRRGRAVLLPLRQGIDTFTPVGARPMARTRCSAIVRMHVVRSDPA
jgi:predicted pyridoxine 5'-phosphate oxidase superfamily flavin-nucleotide-binding protein